MREDYENIDLPDELLEILHDKSIPFLEKMLARSEFYYEYFRNKGKFSLAEPYIEAIKEIKERLDNE